MRIRKLAKELGVHEEVLLGLALEMGLGRYADSEQQLSGEAETRLRMAVRRQPPEARHAARRSEYLSSRPAVRPVLPGESQVMSQAMVGVKPLQPAPAAPKAPPVKAAKVAPTLARSAPPSPAPPSPAPVAAKAVAKVAPPAPAIVPPPPPVPDPEIERLRQENISLRERLTEHSERTVYMANRVARLLEEQERWQRDRESLEAEKHSLIEQCSGLRGSLEQLENRPGLVPLRKVLERRGLIGETEMSMALRGLLEAHWEAPLLGRLMADDPDGLRDFLFERLALVGEGDDPPAGTVAVRVPAERSEADPASAVKDALRRFSTACLINNIKNIVIVGGSPAYHKQLREGLDGRLRLRLVPGDRRGRLAEYPTAEVVILWASTILDHTVSEHYPEGWVIPHRGIARMLNAASDRIEGRNR